MRKGKRREGEKGKERRNGKGREGGNGNGNRNRSGYATTNSMNSFICKNLQFSVEYFIRFMLFFACGVSKS
jgi:hypothetical protein